MQVLPQFFKELWRFKIFRKCMALGINSSSRGDLQINLILEIQKRLMRI